MDDLKLFAKNEIDLETLIQTERIYNQDIGMKFGVEKCTMLIMNSGKRYMMEGIKLTNKKKKKKMRTLRAKETYKYL